VALTVSDRLGFREKRRVALGPLLHHDGGAFCAAGALRSGPRNVANETRSPRSLPPRRRSVEAVVRRAIGGPEHAEIETLTMPPLERPFSLPGGRVQKTAGQSVGPAAKLIRSGTTRR
jgi:hypothetical protein